MDNPVEIYRIFVPVAMLAIWTLLVSSLIPYRRFKSAFAKEVTVQDFKFGESDRVPPGVSVPNRVFINLLEAPLLFYVACLVLFATRQADHVFIIMAWAYFGLRVAHSLVYLTYNNVFHRLSFYGLSNVLLSLIWLRLCLRLWA